MNLKQQQEMINKTHQAVIEEQARLRGQQCGASNVENVTLKDGHPAIRRAGVCRAAIIPVTSAVR